MALSKIIAEGVDLTDTFAFTGTVTGAGLTSPFANTVAVTSENGAATTNLVQGLAKVLAEFDGAAGTITFNDSLNCTSLIDGGTGTYRPQYTNNMTSSSYMGSGCSQASSSYKTSWRSIFLTTTQLNIYTSNGDGTLTDGDECQLVVHGDLA